jgi:hypothetical protein
MSRMVIACLDGDAAYMYRPIIETLVRGGDAHSLAQTQLVVLPQAAAVHNHSRHGEWVPRGLVWATSSSGLARCCPTC